MSKQNQSIIQVRVDEKLKEEVSAIYDELGIDLPTAIRMFLKRSRLVRGIPFDARLTEESASSLEGKRAFLSLREQAVNLPEMSLEEINAEIKESRLERKR